MALISDDIVIAVITKQLDNIYPRIVALDTHSTQSRYAFIMMRLFKALFDVIENDDCIEIYKVDYQLESALPTLHLISSSNVDDKLLEALFDDFTPLLRRVAAGKRLDSHPLNCE
ncbi:hypothetical protein ACDI08_00385 [Vibrio alginolyticus]|uniref:hypothetical protein n=1 Tax=Vibrio TaxID=662 RepID=UPI0006CA7307|nr:MULTISPECIES: hypothetical protein [Vibrio]EHD0127873.1 hypothetical protein [Vibrio alginolyticus]EJE8154716.1 hypothetical protein [Vibrio alginolyticus]KPM89656.1 hypothetical protein AOR09_07760 [Vibrio alginolyticus]KPM99755.1 hypothetical protein AOG25_04615 [Vibrio alginolyticus]MBT0078825.1 hypothetical protein [Vibrio alginolyticus]